MGPPATRPCGPSTHTKFSGRLARGRGGIGMWSWPPCFSPLAMFPRAEKGAYSSSSCRTCTCSYVHKSVVESSLVAPAVGAAALEPTDDGRSARTALLSGASNTAASCCLRPREVVRATRGWHE